MRYYSRMLLLFSLVLMTHAARDYNLESKFGRNDQLRDGDMKTFKDILRKEKIVITLSAAQKPWNVGTLFHATSGKSTLFQLYSRNSESLLILKYSSRQGLRILKIPFDLADGLEHQIMFSMVNKTVSLKLDCKEVLDKGNTPFSAPKSTKTLHFWIGQKSVHHSYFCGNITDFAISAEVPDVECKFERKTRSREPARDHKAEFCPECFNYLKHRVDTLTESVLNLRTKFESFENRVQTVQLHQRGCNDGSTFYAESQSWVTDDCQNCVCAHGKVRCHAVGCPKLNCTRPEKEPGSCCPKCLKSCTYNGRLYDHGHVFFPRKCLECSCENGQERCRHIQPHHCPKLPCAKKDQVTLTDKCCAVCQNIDFCNITHPYPCGPNTLCENGQYGSSCYCKPGYFGDPLHECFDVDECKDLSPEISEQVVGCGHGAICVNTPGSFYCHCKPGFFQLNEKQCFDVILHK